MNKSPSKIKTSRLCSRKFYGVYVERWDTGPKPAADLGTDIHALLEHYLCSGEVPSETVSIDWQQGDKRRATLVALAAVPHLPLPPVPDIELEGWAKIPLPDGTTMIGRVDMWEPDKSRVTDFKTTSDFRYSLTPEQLRVDPQVITYAYSRLGDRSKIVVRFLYLRTRAPHYTKEVEVEFDREELELLWAGLVEGDVARINEIIAAESFADVEPDLSACSAFGGCPFRAKCAALGHQSLGVMSSLFQQQPGKEKKKMTGLRRLKVSELEPLKPLAKKSAEEPVQEKAEETPSEWFAAAVEDNGEEVAEIKATDINPPEEQAVFSESGDVYLEPPGQVAKWTKSQLVGWLKHYNPGYFSELPPTRHRVPQMREDVLTLRRQMGKKDIPAAKPAKPAKPAKVDKPAKVASPKQEQAADKSAASGYILYINCAPSGPYKRLEQILEPIFEQVDQSRKKNEGEQGHYLTIPYGQGPARVAAMLLQQRAELRGAIVIDRRTPVAPSAIEVLSPRAVQVITGF